MSYVPPEGTSIQVTLAVPYTPPAGNALSTVLSPPESGYIFATTEAVVAVIEGTYIAPVLAGLAMQTLGAACQIEGFHAPSVDAALDATTADINALLSLIHIQFASGDLDATTEGAVMALEVAFSQYQFAAVDTTTADAIMVLEAEHDFDLMHGVTILSLPALVSVTTLELPLTGVGRALLPVIDSVTEATYQSYLQGITLPAPTAAGTANYELTLQGVT